MNLHRILASLLVVIALLLLTEPADQPYVVAVPRATNTPAPPFVLPTVVPGPTLTPIGAWEPYPAPADRAASPPSPPAPPIIVWHLDGTLIVTWEGGTLHEATCIRPACEAPKVCDTSPCSPIGIEPGDALIVIGPSGESTAIIVPPRPRLVLLPWVRQ